MPSFNTRLSEIPGICNRFVLSRVPEIGNAPHRGAAPQFSGREAIASGCGDISSVRRKISIDHKTHILALLAEAERLHIDIAPDYKPGYITLAYALVNELGEDGRDIFHRFCRQCDKYDEKNAERTYNSCLKSNRGGCSIGTIIYMCKAKGIDTEAVYKRLLDEERAKQFLSSRDDKNVSCLFVSGATIPNKDEINDEITNDPDPATPLPTFGEMDLPYPLNEIHKRGDTPAQCDAMLLAAITVMGAGMDWHVCTKYSKTFQFPCLQLFIVAKSASGKGAIAKTRMLADILHAQRLGKFAQAQTEAIIEKKKWQESLNTEEPLPKPADAPLELFIIPGNNTGTGILQNIIDSKGNGLIFEIEADTVSTAISGDYGHWSDTLRKAFDHDRLSYNRRTDREYKDLNKIRLGVVLSGTPQQVTPLIPSAENGLFSRQVFYYMPKGTEWINQFDYDGTVEDSDTYFNKLSVKFVDMVDTLKGYGICDMRLTREQMEMFNLEFSRRFKEAQLAFNGEMDSSVIRQAHNCLRVMTVLATLRMFADPERKLLENAQHMMQNPEGHYENLKILSVSDSDFETALHMFKVLYHHSVHLLSFLQSTEVTRRQLSEPLLMLELMPDNFTSLQWKEMCSQNGVNVNTSRGWIKKLKDKGLVDSPERGRFNKSKIYGDDSEAETKDGQ